MGKFFLAQLSTANHYQAMHRIQTIFSPLSKIPFYIADLITFNNMFILQFKLLVNSVKFLATNKKLAYLVVN